jgi:hypothetical protein
MYPTNRMAHALPTQNHSVTIHESNPSPTMKASTLFALLLLVASYTHAALPGAEPLARLITSQFDTNSDHLIDAGEWQSGITDSFDKLDSNSDGGIIPDEIDGIQSEIGRETGDLVSGLVTVVIKQVIFSLDADRNNSVSRKEYSDQSGAFFAKLDADGNGSLSQAELESLPTQLLATPTKPKP